MARIAFIVQRYGTQIIGGSESYCRQIAERLSANHEVEVLTTKATDYVTWKNDILNDEETVNGILIRRFETDQERCLTGELQDRATADDADIETTWEWVKAQGPYCPKLVEYVKEHAGEYDVFVLMTYLYYPVLAASSVIGDKAVLIPTAHDEPAIHMPVFKQLFENSRAWYFLTPEEKDFVEGFFDPTGKILGSGHGGVGVDVPKYSGAVSFRQRYGLGDNPYLVYAGRISIYKGCKDLFRYFAEYKFRNPQSPLKLVLMGSADIPIIPHEDIINLGFASEDDKFSAMAGALALVQPSYFESLSIVLLEAFAVSTPVIVNGKCEVMKGHCRRSNGGLYYDNYLEFERELNYLLAHPEQQEIMGKNGKVYVDANYRWDIILAGLEDIIELIAAKQS